MMVVTRLIAKRADALLRLIRETNPHRSAA